MSLVPKGNNSGWYVGFTFMDNQGDKTNRLYETSAVDEAGAEVILNGLYAELGILSQSQIVGTVVKKELVETSPVFVAGSQNAIRGQLTVQLTGGTKSAGMDIPAPIDGIFQSPSGPGHNVIDTTNASLLQFTAWFGATGPGNGALISDGETVDEILAGKRKSSKKG